MVVRVVGVVPRHVRRSLLAPVNVDQHDVTFESEPECLLPVLGGAVQ